MITSERSQDIYTVDIPRVEKMSAEFVYNFFTPSESVSEDAFIGPEESFVNKFDHESYLKYVMDRTARYVRIKFAPVRLHETRRYDNTGLESRTQITDSKFSLTKNVDKVVDEEFFTSTDFMSVEFNDGDVAKKSQKIVMSSAVSTIFDIDYESDISNYRLAQTLNTVTPDNIDQNHLVKSLGTSTDDTVSFKSGDRDTFIDRISSVSVVSQINSKVVYDLIDAVVKTPTEPSSTDLVSVRSIARLNQDKSITSSSTSRSPVINIQYVSIEKVTDKKKNRLTPAIVGYIIDKIEVTESGTVRLLQSLVIDGQLNSTFIDQSVKYGSTYMYSVRAVARVPMIVVDVMSDDLFMIDVLISSRPSNKVYVDCLEIVPPPCPVELNLRWDYGFERKIRSQGMGRLLLTWSFPVNSQRDIKKFQVFRRRTINEPFLLIKEFDFNDAALRYPSREIADEGVSERLEYPITWFYDMEFERTSDFIYSIAAIDAHEFTSGYSEQFRVVFDSDRNVLKKTLISHSGAPKPYPNMYLEGDTLVDSIIDSNSDAMTVYFNPEFYEYIDSTGEKKGSFVSSVTGGSYKFSVLSMMSQTQQVFTLNIDDRRRLISRSTKDDTQSLSLTLKSFKR